MRNAVAALAAIGGIVLMPHAVSYPLYGSEDRGIRRLEGARLAHEGVVHGRQKHPGEVLPLEQVDLRRSAQPPLELPAPDAELTRRVRAMLGAQANRYGISVLDLSNPGNPRYAEHGGNAARNPGSVGKIVVATALFQALADLYPNDTETRMSLLKNTRVTADEFIVHDSHKVRFWDGEKRKLTRRPLRVGDTGTLFEFLDWMLSASSNAAASMVLEQALLLRHFGKAYPPSEEERKTFLETTPKNELTALLERTIQEPLTRSGIDITRFRQGSFFTRTGKVKVPGTNSYGTPREMLTFLLRMEEGRIVDEWSSRELKRLLYMTERRIRYASSPALRTSAVYFKSGSLYKCVEEPGFTCKKYHGNKLNLMNSIAIVETPAGESTLFYIVTLNSNVLRKNSAVEHQTLATRIHRLLEKTHGLSK